MRTQRFGVALGDKVDAVGGVLRRQVGDGAAVAEVGVEPALHDVAFEVELRRDLAARTRPCCSTSRGVGPL